MKITCSKSNLVKGVSIVSNQFLLKQQCQSLNVS